MSIPQVNAFLHAVLLHRGHLCEWVDSRASPTARYALRAAERHAHWQSNAQAQTQQGQARPINEVKDI